MKGLLRSFACAFRGLGFGLVSGRNIIIHQLAVVVVAAVGLWLGFAAWQWAVCFLCFGLVIGLELVNTAIEKLCDLVEPNQNPAVKKIKDLAAAAVLWAAITAAAAAIAMITL